MTSNCIGILDTFNEQKIQNLTDLARFYGEVLRAGKEEYLRFCLITDEPDSDRLPDIVIERAAVEAADVQICERNQIADVASKDMLPYVRGLSVT